MESVLCTSQASWALKEGCKVDFFHGVRSKEHLLFASRIKIKNLRYFQRMMAPQDLKELTSPVGQRGDGGGAKYDRVMTCGPELMMKSVSDIAWGKRF